MTRQGPSADLVITDLDNTLYDWIDFYVPSFLAMAAEIHRISGVDLSSILKGFRDVHRRHRTSEYAFALQELEPLRKLHPRATTAELLKRYDSAIHVFRSERKRRLRLYPTVKKTLEMLVAQKIPVVALSDSGIHYVSRRLRQLGIDQLVAAVSAPEDHGVPESTPIELVRRVPSSDLLARTLHLPFDPRLRKPDTRTLHEIFRHFDADPGRTVYVGDSLARDVLLAHDAGLIGVWARYGRARDAGQYDQLVRISYWTAKDVADERRLAARAASSPPDRSIDQFRDLLPIVLGQEWKALLRATRALEAG